MDDGQTAMDTSGEHNMSDKLISTAISSYNELTNTSKRVLLDTSVDRVDLKKIKLFDDPNEKHVISLNTEENHINLIIKKTPDQISETTENNTGEHSNVSNEMKTGSNSEKDNFIYDKDSNTCNKVYNIDVDNLKANCEKNINEQGKFISEDESNISFKSFDLEFIQNNSNIYENESLSDNLVTVEKSYVNENCLLTEISSNEENTKDLEEIMNIENKKKTDDIHFTKLSTESADDFKMIKCEDKYDKDQNDDTVVKKIDNHLINNDNDVGTTEKSNISDTEDDETNDFLLQFCTEITKANFPMFVDIFSKKNIEFEHFEAICTKIISLYLEKRIEEQIKVKMNEILEIEKYWREKFMSLSQQVKEYTEEFEKSNKARLHQKVNSVGIQVDMHKINEKHRLYVSKVKLLSQKPQNTLMNNNIVNLGNHGGNVNKTIGANDTNTIDLNDDGCTIINHNVEHMINNNNVQHGISNNVENIVDNNAMVINDDDGNNKNITLNTQLSTLNAMENVTFKKQLQESNMTEKSEESSDFLSTSILNYENFPKISLSSINKYPDIIDLTEDDDDSNDESKAVLQNRMAIDQNLYTQNLTPSGQQFLTLQLPPNNSSQQQQQQLSGMLSNVPTKCMKLIISGNGTKKFVHIRAPPNCPQQLVEFNAPPGSPRQYVKSNAGQTGPSMRSNVSQIHQPNTSAAFVQLPSVSQKTTRRSSRSIVNKHPAPLPIVKNRRNHFSWKKLPSAPILHVPHDVAAEGFVVKWNVTMCSDTASIRSYQFYIYDEARSPPKPTSDTWIQIGEVKALPLPMACSFTLTNPSARYYLSMRAIDIYGRFSPFCEPKSLVFY